MARIIIADEHAAYRKGLRFVLEAALQDVTFADLSSLGELLSLLGDATASDLVLLSLTLTGHPDPGMITALRRVSLLPRYVLVSPDLTLDRLLSCVADGFHGFISKRQTDADIVAAVGEVLAGRIYIPRTFLDPRSFAEAGSGNGVGPDPAAQARNEKPPPTWQNSAFGLTSRQRQVLALLTQGLSNREIARALRIAEPTAKIHVSALMKALSVRNRTEAAMVGRSLETSGESDPEAGDLRLDPQRFRTRPRQQS